MANATVIADIINGHIENFLPIRLIPLPTKKLVIRDDVRALIHATLDKKTIDTFLQLSPIILKRRVRIWIKRRAGYAIFSHRWSNDEPSFEKMRDGKMNHGSTGFKKLAEFCKKAMEYGCDFAWSDICCIDKASSAEFQESLNSMFSWYRHAKVCIAYLGQTTSREDMKYDVWFKRGWTLQELLAPLKMRFYNRTGSR
jgi:hypothetical protein